MRLYTFLFLFLFFFPMSAWCQQDVLVLGNGDLDHVVRIEIVDKESHIGIRNAQISFYNKAYQDKTSMFTLTTGNEGVIVLLIKEIEYLMGLSLIEVKARRYGYYEKELLQWDIFDSNKMLYIIGDWTIGNKPNDRDIIESLRNRRYSTHFTENSISPDASNIYELVIELEPIKSGMRIQREESPIQTLIDRVGEPQIERISERELLDKKETIRDRDL